MKPVEQPLQRTTSVTRQFIPRPNSFAKTSLSYLKVWNSPGSFPPYMSLSVL